MSEGVGDAPHLYPPGANDNGEHIEADLHAARAPGDHPLRRRAPDTVLLDGMDGLRRRPEPDGAARLDLTEHEHLPAPEDDVDLPATAPVVPVEHGVATSPVVGGGEILSGTSQPGARIHALEVSDGVRRKLAFEPGRLGEHVAIRELGQLFHV